MEKNIIKELLKRPVAVNPIFIKITWRIWDGIFLSQVMYWYFLKDKENGQEFYKTDLEWMDELYFSKKELETSKKSLKTLWFISIEKKWKGNRSYYTFCSDNVYEAILTTKEKAKKIPVKKIRLYQKVETSSFPQNGDLGFPETGRELSPKGGNPIYITEITTETTTENIILPNGNIEQSSDSSLWKFEKIENETQEEAPIVSDEIKKSSAGEIEPKEDKRDPDIQLIIDTIKELNGGITDDARDKIRISARNLKIKLDKMKWFNGDYAWLLVALHRWCDKFYKEKFGSVDWVYWNITKIIWNVKNNIDKQENPKNKVTFW